MNGIDSRYQQVAREVVDAVKASATTYYIFPAPFDTVCVGWKDGVFFVTDNGLSEYETESPMKFMKEAPAILEQLLQEFYEE